MAPEPPKSKSRTAFERDRARLIHSSALRRLGAKSQILIAGTDDFARTRLTHTLEVAQIGRQIGALLGCDPDVVDCACLAHDLGHPPFGHNGERALADIASNIGGFEGNAQTMRILTRLEPKIFHPDGRSAGVNLTRAALDAAVKYPWTLAEADRHPKGERSKKFCVYPDDEPVFRWLKIGAPRPPNPWNARSWTFRTISPTPCMTSRIPSPPARSIRLCSPIRRCWTTSSSRRAHGMGRSGMPTSCWPRSCDCAESICSLHISMVRANRWRSLRTLRPI